MSTILRKIIVLKNHTAVTKYPYVSITNGEDYDIEVSISRYEAKKEDPDQIDDYDAYFDQYDEGPWDWEF